MSIVLRKSKSNLKSRSSKKLSVEVLLPSLERAPPGDPGRLWRVLQKSALWAFKLSRDLFWSVLNGGSITREVGPGQKPLERYQFDRYVDRRESRHDWSSRG